VLRLSQGLDPDFYWVISRMKNFDETNLFIFLGVISKYDSKLWAPSRIEIMKDLIKSQYTLVKDLDEENLELFDKRFQSHVSPMFALGLGRIDENGIFHLTEMGRILEKQRNVPEFMTNQMLRWQLPNGSIRVKEKLRKWVDEGRCIIPFILLLKVLIELYDIDPRESYLTNEEIVRFLMPIKTHNEKLSEIVQAILDRRKKGETIRISTREKERAIEDLKILLSYFTGTGLCYIQKSRVARIGGQSVHVMDVVTLRIGKLDVIRRLTKLKFDTFDFSKFDLDTEFQKAKNEWFKYYGSIPSFYYFEEVQVFSDEPLPLPSNKAIQEAISEIKEKLLIDDSVILEVVSNLISGRNVILTGPIGSGKTHLAILIPQLFWKEYGGYYPEVVTATADWTTQDVIGGILPKIGRDKKVTYTIQKGCVYDTVAKNWVVNSFGLFKRSSYKCGDRTFRGVWLIIDEFNRANIDRAFGEMFTSIEHGKLKVPTSKEQKSFEEVPIPKDYRIIGTLNTFDKHYLFRLSDALKRRFAFVEVLPPTRDKAEKENYYMVKRAIDELLYKSPMSEKIFLDNENKIIIRKDSDHSFVSLIDSAYEIISFIRYTKNLGTAILISIVKFILVHNLTNNDLDNNLDLALRSNVTPQLENVSKWSLQAIKAFACENIVEFFKSARPDSVDFNKYAMEFLKLLRYLGKENIQGRMDRFRKRQISEEEWKTYDPWAGKTRPKLPLFRRSLTELIEEIQLI